jgi:hypothetical protein
MRTTPPLVETSRTDPFRVLDPLCVGHRDVSATLIAAAHLAIAHDTRRTGLLTREESGWLRETRRCRKDIFGSYERR